MLRIDHFFGAAFFAAAFFGAAFLAAAFFGAAFLAAFFAVPLPVARVVVAFARSLARTLRLLGRLLP